MDIIYIEWGDAVENNNTWLTKKEAKEFAKSGAYKVRQVGFIIKETKDYILLAARDGEDLVGGVMLIPKGWIIKRINLNKYIK